MINIISKFMEIPPDEVEKELDEVYRVNSDFARQRNLPRDIIVRVLSHKFCDQIFF